MRIYNVIEALGYAIVKFLIYTVIFFLIYSIAFGTNDLLNCLRWCIPIGLGMFLGYLAGRNFLFLQKKKNIIYISITIILLTIIIGILVRKIFLKDPEWISTIIFTVIPLIFGVIKSIPDGLDVNISENYKLSEENSDSDNPNS